MFSSIACYFHKWLPHYSNLMLCFLNLSWRRPLSYRNESIDLRSKLMDWFLYDKGLHHERVNGRQFSTKKCAWYHQHLQRVLSTEEYSVLNQRIASILLYAKFSEKHFSPTDQFFGKFWVRTKWMISNEWLTVAFPEFIVRIVCSFKNFPVINPFSTNVPLI